MRCALVLALFLPLTGCAALGLEGSLDAQSTKTNLRNVESIVVDNEGLLLKSGWTDAEKVAARQRNDAAVKLAESMSESAK